MLTNSLNNNFFISTWQATADPGAGVNAVIQIPDFAQAELVLLKFTIATDANVADRTATLSVLNAATDIPLASSGIAHTASSTLNYIAHQNAVLNTVASADTLFMALPNLRLFNTDDTMPLTIVNIQAGDQISDIIAYWKGWRGASS